MKICTKYKYHNVDHAILKKIIVTSEFCCMTPSAFYRNAVNVASRKLSRTINLDWKI